MSTPRRNLPGLRSDQRLGLEEGLRCSHFGFGAHSRFFPREISHEERLGTTLATAPLQALGQLCAKVLPHQLAKIPVSTEMLFIGPYNRMKMNLIRAIASDCELRSSPFSILLFSGLFVAAACGPAPQTSASIPSSDE